MYRKLLHQDGCSVGNNKSSDVTRRKRVRKALLWTCIISLWHNNCLAFSAVRSARKFKRCRNQQFPSSLYRISTTNNPQKLLLSASKMTQMGFGLFGTQGSGNHEIDSEDRNGTISFDDNYENEDLEFVWEVGDAEQDLNNLQQAIAFHQADNNLREAERMEMLDEFAAQRRLLLPDLHHFVTRTLRVSAILLVLKRISSSRTNQALLNALTTVFDVHFWAIVVATPIIFLKVKQWTKPPPPPIPHELKRLDPEYMQFVKSEWWEDPQTSCSDYITCLLEQWTSAVNGFVLFAMVRLSPLKMFSGTSLSVVQLVTRLAAMASLFQFPELFFKLNRTQQPRPMKLDVTILQSLSKMMLQWGLPLGVSSDMAKILNGAPLRLVIAFYGIAVALLSAMEVAYNQERKPSPANSPSRKHPMATRLFPKIFGFTMASSAVIVIMSTMGPFILRRLMRKDFSLPAIHWRPLVGLLAYGVALAGPLYHLVAFLKLIKVGYMHSLSLTRDPIEFQTLLGNQQERDKHYNWRYRLTWREPQRVHVIVNNLRSKLEYWLFVAGSVQDKLQKETEAERIKHLQSSGGKLWDMIKKDQDQNLNPKISDRTQWKKQAMDRLADIYQKDYDNHRSDHLFRDPLGVAVQQSLGIGLGFNFDHTRKLKDGEKPSIRRLQARAAKSAVRRVQSIWDERNRRAREIMEMTKDSNERGAQLERINAEAERQVQYLADRLSKLIPPPGCFGKNDIESFDLIMFESKNPVIQLGEDTESELMIPCLFNRRSDAVDRLMEQYGTSMCDDKFTEGVIEQFDRMQKAKQRKTSVKKKNARKQDADPPSSGIDNSNYQRTVGMQDSSDDGREDQRDEFVEAYLKKKFGGDIGKEGGNGDDDEMETIIV